VIFKIETSFSQTPTPNFMTPTILTIKKCQCDWKFVFFVCLFDVKVPEDDQNMSDC